MDSRLARWIALSVFAILIVGWVLAAVALSGASAGRPGFPFNLSSRLKADYNSDGGEQISSLRISIVADLLRDLGISIEEGSILDDLDSPVPTATARNFAGDPPFTATVTPSDVPTETPLPTATPTKTPRPLPTKTSEPTHTDEPASTAAPIDTIPPNISDGDLAPPSGTEFGACEGNTIAISNLHVVDPGPSSGMDWVKLKDQIQGSSKDVKKEVSLTSGGWSGDAWDAYYAGSISVSWSEGWAMGQGKALLLPMFAADTPTPEPPTATAEPTATPSETSEPTATPSKTPEPTATSTDVPPTPSPVNVTLWAWAMDVAGNDTFIEIGTYTLPGGCG